MEGASLPETVVKEKEKGNKGKLKATDKGKEKAEPKKTEVKISEIEPTKYPLSKYAAQLQSNVKGTVTTSSTLLTFNNKVWFFYRDI